MPRRRHDMQTIAVDCPVVWASVMQFRCANAADRIKVIDIVLWVEMPGANGAFY